MISDRLFFVLAACVSLLCFIIMYAQSIVVNYVHTFSANGEHKHKIWEKECRLLKAMLPVTFMLVLI